MGSPGNKLFFLNHRRVKMLRKGVGTPAALWEFLSMKSISPWFQTAHLLNGIRKTVSEIEATRSTDERRESREPHATRRQTERRRSRA